MNPDDIARLRNESLDATLVAARSRRLRRRVGAVSLVTAALAVVVFAFIPRSTSPIAIATPSPIQPPIAPAPEPPASPHIIRTAATTVTRITTPGTVSPIRFSTDPTHRVEHIDTLGFSQLFPDKGIAIIHLEGEPAEVVIF